MGLIRNITAATGLIALSSASPFVIHASAFEAATNVASSTVTYDEKYFKASVPVTVTDMIRNIPGGVTIIDSMNRGGQGRGFGSSGLQILIDGKRMSGKANSMASSLSRIQASQVERIDLIRGTAEGLDIRNEGVLINIIMKEGAKNTSSSLVDINFLWDSGNKLTPELLLSHNGKSGKLEYGISVNRDRWIRSHNIDETVFNADRVLIKEHPIQQKKNVKDNKVTSNIAYEFDNGDMLRLNGLYSDHTYVEDLYEDQYDVGMSQSRRFTGFEQIDINFKTKKWEVGGDYEGKFNGFGTLKALFIANHADNDDTIKQYGEESGLYEDIFFSTSDSIVEEQIFRTSMSSAFTKGQTIEYGIEAAFNSLDITQSFNDDPAESSLVKEDRYEAFVTHTIKVGSKWNISSALNREFSKISQASFDVTNSRKFQFWKPRIEARYDMTPTDQFRLLAERSASQLDLSHFVASRNVSDDTIDFGNPNLKPETTWRYALSYEHRLANDGGSLEATVFYEEITDHIDRILIGEDSSGVGNVGSASRKGLDLKANLRLTALGLKDAMVTLKYNYRDASVLDTFTGLDRILRRTPKHMGSIDFRHDIKSLKLTYGFNLHKRSHMYRTDVYINEVSTFRPHWSWYAEYVLASNMKLRFDAGHVLFDKKIFDKTYYTGHIADGVVDRIDHQLNKANPDFSLKLQATF